MAVFVRNEFNYDMDAASLASGLECLDPSMSVQDTEGESDINTIVRRFGLGGTLPVGARMPTYGDFTGIGDYRQALMAMKLADDSFAQLPAEIRERFHNSPAEFVDFCSDTRNLDEARKLGMVKPEEAAVAAATIAVPVDKPAVP